MTTSTTRVHRIPDMGTEVVLNHTVITRAPRADGNDGTPVLRLRKTLDGWETVGLHSNGLMVFLNDMPEPDHTHIRISSVVGTGKAVYADSFKCK